MSARCGKCGSPVEDPARCSNGHAQPLDTPARLAALIGETVDYDLLADKVAERLRGFVPDLVAQVPAESGLVDAREMARRIGKRREWVYRHKHEIGAVPLGKGPRPRWGFDPERSMVLLEATGDTAEPPRPTRTPRPLPSKVPLLPVKDRAA